METIDMAQTPLRELNAALQAQAKSGANAEYVIENPRGAHAVACGLDGPLSVTVKGSTGYYCAGMNQRAEITVHGMVGVGVAENMMSGLVRVKGHASQSALATACCIMSWTIFRGHRPGGMRSISTNRTRAY